MDNNKQIDQYPQCQCLHGRCKNHNPDWENIGEKKFEPDPINIFGIAMIKIWLNIIGSAEHCCGKRMSRYKITQIKRCKQCGRTENYTTCYNQAFCLCCGSHHLVVIGDMD